MHETSVCDSVARAEKNIAVAGNGKKTVNPGINTYNLGRGYFILQLLLLFEYNHRTKAGILPGLFLL
jgi:hypothetical protein